MNSSGCLRKSCVSNQYFAFQGDSKSLPPSRFVYQRNSPQRNSLRQIEFTISSISTYVLLSARSYKVPSTWIKSWAGVEQHSTSLSNFFRLRNDPYLRKNILEKRAGKTPSEATSFIQITSHKFCVYLRIKRTQALKHQS